MLFRPEKGSSKKLEKIDILQRGESMVFVNKSTFVLYVFFEQKKPETNSFWYSGYNKECFSDLRSEVLTKSRKSSFSKGVSSWFLSKNLPFSYIFFFEQKKEETNGFLYSG